MEHFEKFTILVLFLERQHEVLTFSFYVVDKLIK